jgi:hypothetical protein
MLLHLVRGACAELVLLAPFKTLANFRTSMPLIGIRLPDRRRMETSSKRLGKRIVANLNEKRPGRMCDRVVKSKPRRYAVQVPKKVLI